MDEMKEDINQQQSSRYEKIKPYLTKKHIFYYFIISAIIINIIEMFLLNSEVDWFFIKFNSYVCIPIFLLSGFGLIYGFLGMHQATKSWWKWDRTVGRNVYRWTKGVQQEKEILELSQTVFLIFECFCICGLIFSSWFLLQSIIGIVTIIIDSILIVIGTLYGFRWSYKLKKHGEKIIRERRDIKSKFDDWVKK